MTDNTFSRSELNQMSDDAMVLLYLRAQDRHDADIDKHVAHNLGYPVDRVLRAVDRLERERKITRWSLDCVRLSDRQLDDAGGRLDTAEVDMLWEYWINRSRAPTGPGAG